MPRTLVTGAFGYLGLALLQGIKSERLVAFGHPPRSDAAWRGIPSDAVVVEGGLFDVSDVLRAPGPFDPGIHLAGGGGAPECTADPGAGICSNLRGTSG